MYNVVRQRNVCMKKVLLFFLLLIFTCLTAGAAQVFYGAGGVPIAVSYGGGARHSINNFGSNAAFLPHNRIRAGQRIRARKFAQTRAQILAQRHANRILPPQSVNVYARPNPPMSRFDRNYTISSGRRYVRNGIIYFD